MKRTILYIHGVGGENSTKYDVLKRAFPDYNVEKIKQSDSITETLSTIENRLKQSTNEKFILVGSSRGGLISLYIGYDYDIPVIAINPALEMSKVNFDIGNRELLEELRDVVLKENNDLDNARLTYLFLGSNDELIDYKVAAGLNNAVLSIRETNHRYEDFETIIPDIKEIVESYEQVVTESDVFEEIL